jgi:iron-regulated transporter 1
MWDIGIIFLIADLTSNSLSLVALAGFLNNFVIFLFMSSVGQFLDTANRLYAAEIALSTKLLTLTTAYTISAYLTHSAHNPSHELLIYALPILCAIAGLSFNTISQSVEKDWIVVLSAGNPAWLTTTNSIMTQIDSGVNSIAPAITGYLFAMCTPTISAIVLLSINLVATMFLYFFMRGLYHSCPALALRGHRVLVESAKMSNFTSNSSGSSQTNSSGTTPAKVDQSNSVSSIWQFCWGVSEYDDFRNSGCANAMMSYAFLFFTVLSFGSLMTVYLRSAGVGDGWIGVARGASAFTGLLGAVIFPFACSKFGLFTTASIAIIFQDVLVVAAAASFFLCPIHVSVIILIFAVLFSRTGLWMFDLGVRQIAQETIPEYCRGKVNGQWRTMTAFFEMTIFCLALLIPGNISHPLLYQIVFC